MLFGTICHNNSELSESSWLKCAFWSALLGKSQIVIWNFPNGDLPLGQIFDGFSHWFSSKIKNCKIQKHLNLKVVVTKMKQAKSRKCDYWPLPYGIEKK